jgi:AcrR family transcriptional regulator
LLDEGGVEAVTLRAVGERAGVSRQAPYNHFADKAALLSVLAARYLQRLGEGMTEAAKGAGEDPFEGLVAMMEAYVRFALENPSRYRLICQEAGELPGGDPVELAAILFATTHGAVELTLSGHAEEEKGLGDPTRLVRALLARLRRN